MRYWIFVAAVSGMLVLAGCCPEVMKQRKPPETAKVPAETPAPAEVPVPTPTIQPQPSVPPPKVTPATPAPPSQASPTQIAMATKGEDIPQTPVPPGTKFVSPAEISPQAARVFQNIYFDFDRYDLKLEAQAILKEIAGYLLQNPAVKVMIEGHCDERGTREYNLVLGEQRSLSARRYLITLGVAPGRLFTTSYGKDKPADPRSNEEAWAKNRRCEFKLSLD